MNMLVAGRPEILIDGNWQDKMHISAHDSGNNVSQADIVTLSQAMDLDALRAYRQAVGRGTQTIIKALKPGDVGQNVDVARIQQVRDSGAVVAAASDIMDYWQRQTIAGLLLIACHPGTTSST